MKGLSIAAISDGYAGLSVHCRAQVSGDLLVAPFWLQFDHFDPALGAPKHTMAQALRAYRESPSLRGLQHRHVRVAYADYRNLNGRQRPAVPVWLVVAYRIRAPSFGPTGGSMVADQVSIINDKDLRPRSTIETLPSRCS